MKHRLLLQALALGFSLSAGAQINSTTDSGALLLGRQLYRNGCPQGATDRAAEPNTHFVDRDQARAALWDRCIAAYADADWRAEQILNTYIESYPASSQVWQARLLLANTMLGEGRWGEAIDIYSNIDESLLSRAGAADLNYHHGYARLRVAELDASERLFEKVRADATFGDAARFYLGYINYCGRDYDKALPYFETANRRTNPGYAAPYYLAQIYFAKGNYDKAISEARAVIDNPTVQASEFIAEAHRIAGEALYAKGRESDAIKHLRKHCQLAEAPQPSAQYILGYYEYTNANFQQAVDYLTPVSECDNAMGQSAYLYIGESLMRLDRKDAALMAFDHALRMDYDKNVQEAAFYNYAVAKYSGANIPFGSSVATFEEFLRRFPTGRYAPAVQEYLVSGYLTDGDYAAALTSINRMQNPGEKIMAAKQQVLYALGSRALSTGDSQAAYTYLHEATSLARYNSQIATQVQLTLGEALYRLERYDQAHTAFTSYLRTAAKNDANYPLALYDRGYALFAQKKYAEAAIDFRAFVDAPGTLGNVAVADALNRLGDVAYYGEQFDQSTEYYRRAFDLFPSAGDYPMFQQGVIAGFNRDYTSKISILSSMIEKFPTSSLIPDALLEITEAYLRQGRNADAIATYRRLVADYPATEQGRRGYVQLALTLLNSGDRAGAIEAYRQVVKQYPTSDEARTAIEALQRIAAEDGTLAELQQFLASVDNAPQLDVAQNDRLTFEAAEQAYITQANTDRLKKYLDEYPAGAYRCQAMAYLMEAADRAGQPAEALRYATTIVDQFPDTRTAENALYVKAQSEHALGYGEEALASWQALEHRASSPAMLNSARVGVMRVARDLGNGPLMLSAAEALLASSTLGSEVRNEAIFTRAMAHHIMGDEANARSGWKEIADQTDDIYGAKSAFYYANSLYEGNRISDALTAVNALIDAATPHTYWLARAFILLSDIYQAQGKTYEAREYLRSLRENYPGSETDIFQMIDQRLSNLK